MALKNKDENFSPTYYSVVCSIHFTNDDYVLENGIFELSPTAVPSIFIKDDPENTVDKNNGMVDSNDDLRVSEYNAMIEENEPDNLPNSVPVILTVYGTYDSTEESLEDSDSNDELPPCNKKHQNQISSNSQPLKKIKINDNASTSSSSVPIDTISSLNPSSSLRPSCSLQLNDGLRPSDDLKPSSIKSSDRLRPSDSPRPSSSLCTTTNRMDDFDSKDIDSDPNSVWIVNQPRHVAYKDELSLRFRKRLESLAQGNRRLISRSTTLMTSRQMLLDIELKYLQLRNQVLETEEALLEKGINTSEYPLFQVSKNNVELPQKVIEHQVLLECKLTEINNQLYNNSSASQSTKVLSEVELPSDNENSMP